MQYVGEQHHFRWFLFCFARTHRRASVALSLFSNLALELKAGVPDFRPYCSESQNGSSSGANWSRLELDLGREQKSRANFVE